MGITKEFVRAMRTHDELYLTVAIGLFAGFLALLFMAVSDYVYKHSIPLMTTMWVIAGLGMAAKVCGAPYITQKASSKSAQRLKPMRISSQLRKLETQKFTV